MENRFKIYPGLSIRQSISDKGTLYVSIWMTKDEWEAFKKLGLKNRLKKKFQLIENCLYADNTRYETELQFSVKVCEWSEFQKSRLFLDLAAYAELLYHEKECMHIALHEQECIQEMQESRNIRIAWDFPRRVSALIGRILRHN